MKMIFDELYNTVRALFILGPNLDTIRGWFLCTHYMQD